MTPSTLLSRIRRRLAALLLPSVALLSTHAAPPQAGPAGRASVKSLQLHHNAIVNECLGIRFRAVVSISGERGRVAHVAVVFRHQNGQLLRNFDAYFGNNQGHVVTLAQFVPRADPAEESVDLFIPLSQLHLGPGFHALECWAIVFNHPQPGSWNAIATSQAQPFKATIPAPRQRQQQFARPAAAPMQAPMQAPNQRICSVCNSKGYNACAACGGAGFSKFGLADNCTSCGGTSLHRGRGWNPCPSPICPYRRSIY